MNQGLENLSKSDLISLLREKEARLSNQEIQLSNQEVELSNHKAQIAKHEIHVANLRHLIEKLNRMLFGSKKEKFIKEPVDSNQLNLPFEELAKKDESASDQPVKQTITYERKKNENHHGRNKLPENLPVHEIIIEPLESTEGLEKIGEERTETLEYTPGRFFRQVIIRFKYALKNGEGILIGDLPSRPIEKCLAGNVLLSHILISKYVDHLPLYRQQQMFKRAGITIAPSTIDGWISQLGALLQPLYDAMVNVAKQDGYLQVDETPTRVLDKNKKGECHLGYYWVYHTPLKRMVVFDYQRGRNKEAPRKILDDFQGYLQTDGYASYHQYHTKQGITHLACWAHVRRYFDQALNQDKARAEHALEQIQKLYAIERNLKEALPEDRKEQRLLQSLPIINELGKWISQQNKMVLPKSPIGKAFMYCINLWDSLQSYLYNGELLIDNNLIENTIRPNAIGRKNYLFAGSDQGAKRSAMFYSFTGTCKLNGIDPMLWLTEVLNKIADHKVNRLYELFPQNLMLKQNT